MNQQQHRPWTPGPSLPPHILRVCMSLDIPGKGKDLAGMLIADDAEPNDNRTLMLWMWTNTIRVESG